MKKVPLLSALAIGFLASPFLLAQSAPSTAPAKPANATGVCKDGTYSTNATKSGACSGHHGVKEWYAAAAAPATTPAPAATPAPPKASTPSATTQTRTQSQAAAQAAGQSPTPPATQSVAPPASQPAAQSAKKSSVANMAAAPGGGPGLVWVNTSTKVYHCPGTEFYGKTKNGSYMSEADAKNKGARIAKGEVCTK